MGHRRSFTSTAQDVKATDSQDVTFVLLPQRRTHRLGASEVYTTPRYQMQHFETITMKQPRNCVLSGEETVSSECLRLHGVVQHAELMQDLLVSWAVALATTPRPDRGV